MAFRNLPARYASLPCTRRRSATLSPSSNVGSFRFDAAVSINSSTLLAVLGSRDPYPVHPFLTLSFALDRGVLPDQSVRSTRAPACSQQPLEHAGGSVHDGEDQSRLLKPRRPLIDVQPCRGQSLDYCVVFRCCHSEIVNDPIAVSIETLDGFGIFRVVQQQLQLSVAAKCSYLVHLFGCLV
mmetsp:Transcript_9488/g.18473  ORF Transcript_9488/g.18473 Transcript_9488/m.18473 type:complete len:182 (+) Transcript_9488:1138-1683(+)